MVEGVTLISRSRIVVVLVAFGLSLVGAGYLWRVNQVSVLLDHPSLDGELTVVAGESEPLRVEVEPARRVDGLAMSVDGVRVPHPAGDSPGEVLWDPSALEAGFYELRIEVPRPSWYAWVATVDVIVMESD